uniref:Uncharacterized protein n=1 Tax=Oryza sativa subsp. japonica TaxID=39947 RepID=Q67W10_ORYSJ|nr:hypothetical protein [Oryza sativa Japonica Group]
MAAGSWRWQLFLAAGSLRRRGGERGGGGGGVDLAGGSGFFAAGSYASTSLVLWYFQEMTNTNFGTRENIAV